MTAQAIINSSTPRAAHECDTTYYSIGEYRGKRRVWLEGLALEKRGFTKGVNYRRETDWANGVIRLVVDDNGKLVVSGKEKKKGSGEYIPIIDTKNDDITAITEGADEVRVDFDDNVITISVAHLVKQQRRREQLFWKEVESGTLSEGTLCAGIGMSTKALHDGFSRHGIALETHWLVDRETKYLQVACDNNPAVTRRTRIISGRMEEIETDVLTPVSICQFSLSCRGHSPSGKSKRKLQKAEQHPEDATGILGLSRLMDSINAAIWVSENVPQAADSATYAMLRAYFALQGFHVTEFILDSEQSGSFENRRRYWMVAVSSGIGEFFEEDIPQYPRTYAKLAELLDDVPDDDPSWSDNQYLKDKQVRDAAAGKGFAKRQLLDPSTAESCGTINRSYHKRQSTTPFIVRADGKERLFTLGEQARAKSCSPSLVAGVNFTTGTEGLGQGIDMRQAEGIAEAIALRLVKRALAEETKPVEAGPEGQLALAI